MRRGRLARVLFQFAGLAGAVATSYAQSLHLDFEPPDARFDGWTYQEGVASYRHDQASHVGGGGRGFEGGAAGGSQCLWVDLPSYSGEVRSNRFSRREWHFGRSRSSEEVWYSYYLKFDSTWENPGVYQLIFNQVRAGGAFYGFNGSLAVKPGSASGDIVLQFRKMTGGKDQTTVTDTGYQATGFQFERDRWYFVKVNYFHAPTGGYYKAWIDGEQVVDSSGFWRSVNYDDLRIRLGLYSRAEPRYHKIYIDEFRQGGTEAEVDIEAIPGDPPDPDSETWPNIESYTGFDGGEVPENIIDGDMGASSRWSSRFYPQSVTVDYGENTVFDGAEVYTYQDRAYQYTIGVSDEPDGGFVNVVDRSSNTTGVQPIRDSFASVSGRYVRLEVTGASGYDGDWVSIRELVMVEEGRGGPDSPRIVSVSATGQNQVEISFSKPVESSSAENIANYTIGNGISVASASLNEDGETVLLATSDLATDVIYTLTVSNVTDREGEPNPIAPGSDVSFVFRQEDPALLGWWKLDEGAGAPVQDSSRNHNDGSLVNGAGWAPAGGAIGGALELDGQDDRVDLGSLDVSGDQLSIALWFRADDFDVEDGRLLSKATGVQESEHYWMLSTYGGSQVRMRLKVGGVTQTLISEEGAIAAQTWYHLAGVYDGRSMKIFLDGDEIASVSVVGAVATDPTIGVSLGDQPEGGGARPFDGLLDDVRIYSRALSPQSINALITGASSQSEFSSWLEFHSLDVGRVSAHSDFDGDGSSNLQEFFLGGNPRQNDSQILVPKLVVEEGVPGRVFFEFRKATNQLEYWVEHSGNLIDWEDVAGLDGHSETVSGADHDGVDRYRVGIDASDVRKSFLRLVISAE